MRELGRGLPAMNQGKTWQEDIKEPRGYTFGPSFLQISYTREKLFNKLNVKLKLNIFKFFLEVKTTEDKYFHYFICLFMGVLREDINRK